jgi:YegS/Rv2252/BmrU family lipid kinase
MVHSIKLIYNPESKGGKSKKVIPKIKEYLFEQGIDYEFIETEGPLDGIKQGSSAKEEGFRIVCAVGGDGTAHEVGNGAIQSGLTLGVIPVGSGNDFAAGLGIHNNWESGIETLLNGKKEKISVTKAGERYSINVIDAGLGADVAKVSENHLRWISGSKKYTMLMFPTLAKHKAYPVKLIIDGEEYSYDLNILAVGFGQSFGSGMNILPEARYHHKKFQIVSIHSAGRFKILRLFPKVFDGSHVEVTDHVDIFQASELVIETDSDNKRTLRSEAEGELFWEGSITMEAIPEGLEVIIPQDWSFENKSLKVKQDK